MDDGEIALISQLEREALAERSRPLPRPSALPAALGVQGGSDPGGSDPGGAAPPRAAARDDLDWLIAGDDGGEEPEPEAPAEDWPVGEDQPGEPVPWTWGGGSRNGVGVGASRPGTCAGRARAAVERRAPVAAPRAARGGRCWRPGSGRREGAGGGGFDAWRGDEGSGGFDAWRGDEGGGGFDAWRGDEGGGDLDAWRGRGGNVRAAAARCVKARNVSQVGSRGFERGASDGEARAGACGSGGERRGVRSAFGDADRADVARRGLRPPQTATGPGCSPTLRLDAFLPAPLAVAMRGEASDEPLHAWQIECLSLPGVLEGRSLAFAAPTSAGKSLVATALLLRRVSATGRPALVVLPYVSLCEQWTRALERPLRAMGRSVARAYGTSSAPLPGDAGAVICTIERAGLLVNRLLAAGELDALCCCVVDELHMVADPSRGHQLETLLAKLRYAASMSGDASPPPPPPRSSRSDSTDVAVEGTVAPACSAGKSPKAPGTSPRKIPEAADISTRKNPEVAGAPARKSLDVPGTSVRTVPDACVVAWRSGQAAGRGGTAGACDGPSGHPAASSVPLGVGRAFCAPSGGSEACGPTAPEMLPPIESVGNPSALQIVGMSATISNLETVGAWLGAATYATDFRPVALNKYVKVSNELQDASGRVVRRLAPPPGWPSWDRDLVCWMALETAAQGRRVLIFCATKHHCEVTAKNVASLRSRGARGDPSGPPAALAASDGGEDALAPLVACGVAFHHAGLTPDRRRAVERLFLSGAVDVLVATSTLAVGVNLPARRVIIQHGYVRQPTAENALSPELYAQMAGRAGRCGMDDEGECVLVAGKCMPLFRARELMAKAGAEVRSRLTSGDGMRRAVLDVVAAGAVSTTEDVLAFFQSTLLASTADKKVAVAAVKDAIKWLVERGSLLKWCQREARYSASALGRACFESGMSPDHCVEIHDDLRAARSCLVATSELHIAYLCVPAWGQRVTNWDNALWHLKQLKDGDASVLRALGVGVSDVEVFVSQRRMRSTPGAKSQARSDRVCRVASRLWTALLALELADEVDVADACKRYCAQEQAVRDLRERCARSAGGVARLCHAHGWEALELLALRFQSFVSPDASEEVAALAEIRFVGPAAAKRLLAAGISTPEELSAIRDPTSIEQALACGRVSRAIARQRARAVLVSARDFVANRRRGARKRPRPIEADRSRPPSGAAERG